MNTSQQTIFKQLPKPTAEQQAILRSERQCKLVVAVPGSGKTTLLFQAIQQHIKANKGRCLMLTFSKKSDTDNQKKSEALFANKDDLIDIRTFDSFCYKVVTDHWREAGYSKKPKFDNDFQVELLKKVYDSIKKKSVKDKLPYKAVLELLQKKYKSIEHFKKYLKHYKGGKFLQSYKGFIQIKIRFFEQKKRNAILDFELQVSGCYRVLKNYPEVLQEITNKFGLILIDEVQDLSPTEMKIAILLAQSATRSILVGDDAQSIYAFRGVTGNNLHLLTTKVANTVTYNLTQTHRCTKQVALLASIIRSNIEGVSHIEMRSEKEGDKPRFVGFKNHGAQYDWVADYIVTLHEQGIQYSEIAIIARKNESLAQVQRKLQARNIRFNSKYYTGQEGLEKELDAVVNLLRLLQGNVDDDVILPLFMFFNIAPTDDYLKHVYDELKSKTVKAQETDCKELKALGNLIRRAYGKKSLETKCHHIIELLLKRFKATLKYYLKSHLTHFTMRSRQVSNTEALIEEIITHRNTVHDGANSVSLVTAHSSKGLEFKVVFLVDADQSMFPYIHSQTHSDDPNDELKLFYVAITRCSQSLILSCVKNKEQDRRPTEFVSKLNQIKRVMDCLMVK
jgi:DNA helicase-2/ATP-dependent DNA helicase PcrA